MSGVIGICLQSPDDYNVAKSIYYALFALQHRGQILRAYLYMMAKPFALTRHGPRI